MTRLEGDRKDARAIHHFHDGRSIDPSGGAGAGGVRRAAVVRSSGAAGAAAFAARGAGAAGEEGFPPPVAERDPGVVLRASAGRRVYGADRMSAERFPAGNPLRPSAEKVCAKGTGRSSFPASGSPIIVLHVPSHRVASQRRYPSYRIVVVVVLREKASRIQGCVKGGCWDDGPFGVRCAYRGWYLPPSSSGTGPGDSDYIGFRVAR